MDEYVTLVLLALFNPVIDSVRALRPALALHKVGERLGAKRFSLGSVGESVRGFDPDKLRAVVQQLAGELRRVDADADPRVRRHLAQPPRVVDGTVRDAMVTAARLKMRTTASSRSRDSPEAARTSGRRAGARP